MPEPCRAADELNAPIRGLLLNAGVWPLSRQASSDGLELGFATNHVGHMQLATRLLPRLRDGLGPGDEARIVSVASSAHGIPGRIDVAAKPRDGWGGRPWDSSVSYGEGKLANVLFSRELADRELVVEGSAASPIGRVTCLSCHPGVVATSLFRDFFATQQLPGPAGSMAAAALAPARVALEGALPSAEQFGRLLDDSPLKLLLKSPSQGARTPVFALVAPGLPTGAYLSDQAI